MKRLAILLSLLLSFSHYSPGQDASSIKDSIIKKIIDQVILFPQEKLYLQIDKPLYLPGEKVWFRAWLVDAVLHKPITNQYVYVELINPLRKTVNRVIIRQNQGALSGYLLLNENLPEGDYTLCAYTENMLNLGEDYFFKKNISIKSPLSATERTEVSFKFDTDDKLTADVSFEDIKTQKRIKPEGLNLRVNDQPIKEGKMINDTLASYSFNLQRESRTRVLYVENKKYGKFISVPFPADDYDVSFYPEGGYLLEGVSCIIAFKALNSSGLPEEITGKIIDSIGNIYAQTKTTHDGMGLLSLVPQAGTNYYMICKNEKGKEKKYRLPTTQKGMYSLKVETIQNKLFISVLQSSDILEPKPRFLLLHTRGIVHYAAPWDNNYNTISFDLNKFPSGVMQIMLFDNYMNPLSERLVFCRNNDQAQVKLETDQQNYKSRQQVKASLKISDRKGVPLEGTFSVSITDDNDIKPDSSSTILTTLLLTSELKGYIRNPAYYFMENNPEAANTIDLLMMTNGWRRYNIPNIVNGKFDKLKVPIKQGMEITGKVKRLLLDKPVINGKVSILSWEAGYYEEKETDNNGRFAFNGIEYPDSSTFVLQAVNKIGSNEVELFVDTETFPLISQLPANYSTRNEIIKEPEQLTRFIAKADSKYTYENGLRTINIDDVVISGGASEKKIYSSSFYIPKNLSKLNQLTEKDLDFYQYNNLSEILVYMPFTRIVLDAEEGQDVFRRKVIIERMSYRINTPGEPEFNFATLIVDGVIIQDYDIDDVVNTADIESISVLKGAQASILGGDGAGGAIVITTKKGLSQVKDVPKYNIKKVTPMGYQKPAEFYSPRYETAEQRNNLQPDLRTTIYWNPNIYISSSGEAIFDFYTADASTTYSMLIEGISTDGSIIQNIKKISRK